MGSKAEFKVVQMEDGDSAPLLEKFGINKFPTLVYSDGSGKELTRSGAYGTPEEFQTVVSQFIQK